LNRRSHISGDGFDNEAEFGRNIHCLRQLVNVTFSAPSCRVGGLLSLLDPSQALSLTWDLTDATSSKSVSDASYENRLKLTPHRKTHE